MIIRDSRRLAIIIGPLIVLAYITARLYYDQSTLLSGINTWVENTLHPSKDSAFHEASPKGSSKGFSADDTTSTDSVPTSLLSDVDPFATHHEIFSVSTSNKQFFHIKFGQQPALNPNILPHPLLPEIWVIVAQKLKPLEDKSSQFAELVCSATFKDDVLQCVDEPEILPIASTAGSDKCEGKIDYFSLNVGPHDARIFYGPHAPYTIYGSNSLYTCFGQWVQDLRSLVPWGMDFANENKFKHGTEIQRPQPYFPIEKNWFLFWDKNDQIYVHYDVAPRRVFAKLAEDGTSSANIASFAEGHDQECMARLMPAAASKQESIHQATNSLAITLCYRSDPSCKAHDSNTFIFIVFQHKTFRNFHSEYTPYVMLFKRQAPFEIYGISRKPLWIHGRQRLDAQETQMFYVVSMSWKDRGQKYHGYLDDVVFLSFGIEDQDTGGIDVSAETLLKGLGLCTDS